MEEIQGPLASFFPMIMIALGVTVVAIPAWIIWSKSSHHSHGASSAELEFERQMLNQFGSRRASVAPSMPPSLAGAPAAPPAGPASAPVPESPAAPPSVRGTISSPGAGDYDDLAALARSVASRLNAGGMLEGVEGPLRSRNPEITGTILRVRGGKKIAVIETGWRTPDPDLEMVLSLLDGAVIPGPGDEPLFVRRLQNYIGDAFNL